MLVLSRREGQTIRLPGLDIEISVLKTQGGRVQIGIEAPREIAIQRGERVGADEPSATKQRAGQQQTGQRRAAPPMPAPPMPAPPMTAQSLTEEPSLGGLGHAGTRTRAIKSDSNIVRSAPETYWVATA